MKKGIELPLLYSISMLRHPIYHWKCASCRAKAVPVWHTFARERNKKSHFLWIWTQIMSSQAFYEDKKGRDLMLSILTYHLAPRLVYYMYVISTTMYAAHVVNHVCLCCYRIPRWARKINQFSYLSVAECPSSVAYRSDRRSMIWHWKYT